MKIGLRITGFLIILLAIIGLIATTLLSISGGAEDYINVNKFLSNQNEDLNGLMKISGFIITTIFIQLMIFTVSAIKTFIYLKFNRHSFTTTMLQNGLLIISVYYNYNFFGNDGIIKLLLCALLDISVMKLVSLGIDLITLNYSHVNQNENIGFLKMIIYNLTAKYKMNALRKFNYNKAQINSLMEKDSEEIKSEKVEAVKPQESILLLEKNTEDKTDNKNIEKEELINVIYDNLKDDNICPSVSFLKENSNLNDSKINALKKELRNAGVLTTENRKTIVNVDKETALKEVYVNVQ
jgi:hypothetical protein